MESAMKELMERLSAKGFDASQIEEIAGTVQAFLKDKLPVHVFDQVGGFLGGFAEMAGEAAGEAKEKAGEAAGEAKEAGEGVIAGIKEMFGR